MEEKNDAAIKLLAEGIRNFMHRMRWTQERLAKELGFKRQGSISAVLRGRAQLNYSQIFRLLCLGMTLRELFGDSVVDAETATSATTTTPAGERGQAFGYEQAAPAGGQALPFGYAHPAYAPAFGQTGFGQAPASAAPIYGAATSKGFINPTSARPRSLADDALSFERERLRARAGEGGARAGGEAPGAAEGQGQQASPELAARVAKLEQGIELLIKTLAETKAAPAPESGDAEAAPE